MKNKAQQFLSRQSMLTNNYEIFHFSDNNLERVNLHHHDFYEIYFFISGNVTYVIEGRAYSLEPGDIILINSNELHQPIINKNELPYERMVLWLDKNFIAGLCSEKTDLKRCFEDNKKENVIRSGLDVQHNTKSIFNKLLNLENYRGTGSDMLYKAYIIELLIILNNFLFFNSDKYYIEINKSSLIDAIIQYINNHLDEDIKIDDLSNQFFISKFHLLREFRKHSGTTIHKFIIQKKLILAKELILTGIPIIQVYEQCGFGDYSNFFRAFKNEYGITPKYFFELMSREN